MIFKIYKTLALVQIGGTTALGMMFYGVTGMIVGFVAGVLIAGHFLTTLSTRELNVENAKTLKELLKEIKKMQPVLDKNLPKIEQK